MVDALATKGIIEPFPIQEQTIPLGLSGQDIIGQAKTGTGKTLGFGLPLLQALGTDPEPGVKALVVVPTRELCVQVAEDLVLAASNRATKVVAINGGPSYALRTSAINAKMRELSKHNHLKSNYQLTPFSLAAWKKVQ